MTAPKLRFKEFDGDWLSLKYKDVLTIKYGKDHKLLEEGNIPVYGTGGIMRYANRYLYDGESILIGRKGTIDQPKYVNEKFWTVDTLFYTEIKNNAVPLFLFQHSLQVNWLGLNEATGVPSLNTTSINNVDIGIPPKEEQTKIASFLSAVDEKISQLTQKHALLSQYKQGMMQKLFSQQIRFKADDGSEFGEWEEKKLGDVCSRNYQGINTVADKVEYQKVGYPILQAKHITSEKLDFYDARFLSELDFEKYKDKYIPNPNDILFSNIGTIGKVVLVDESKPFFIAWNIFLISVKMNLTVPLYLALYLRWLTSLNYFDNLQTGNATKFINKTDLLDTKVNLPCLEEQTKNANFLSAIDQKIAVVAQQIEQAKVWKKGLLQQMFV